MGALSLMWIRSGVAVGTGGPGVIEFGAAAKSASRQRGWRIASAQRQALGVCGHVVDRPVPEAAAGGRVRVVDLKRRTQGYRLLAT